MSKILVVDKEGCVCKICGDILHRLDHEIVCAVDTQEAVELAEKGCFDLAIISIAGRITDELTCFEMLRLATPMLEGILLTANASLEMVLEAMKNGFSRVCGKPLVEKEIIEAVVGSIKIGQLRQEVMRMRTLLPLYKLGQRFISATSEQKVYEVLIEGLSRELGVPSVSIMKFDEVAGSLKIAAHKGLDAQHIENLEIKSGEKISGRVFSTAEPIILNRDGRHRNPYAELMERDNLSAAISFPLISGKKVWGVLNISQTREGICFNEGDIEMLSIVTSQAMMALENIRSMSERAENRRVRTMLEQYVSQEVSRMLVETNQNLLDVGEVQELTVLFADIRNFTFLVQHLEPSKMREFLNSFFDFFSSAVFAGQGMLDKLMGDGALVIFGAPVKIDNPNVDAVAAACRIMTSFAELRAHWMSRAAVFEQVGLGIGISRGEMFLGNIGSSRRLDYTVIGTDVNIAQRLAAETIPGQILITERVYQDLDGKFSVKTVPPMLLRGMESPVAVYSVEVS